jgi:hypothetical protein
MALRAPGTPTLKKEDTQPMRSRRSIRITLALLPLCLFGCGDSRLADDRVSLHPANAALSVGGSQNFTADVTAAKACAHRAEVYSAPGVPA